MGQRAQGDGRRVQCALDLVEHADDGRRLGGQCPSQLHLDGDGREVGLGAVVQVALEPASLGIGDRDQPGARGAQVVVAAAQVVDRAAQLAVEFGVVQHGGDEAGDAPEGLVVAVVEVVGAGVAVHDEQSDQRPLHGERGEAHRTATDVQRRQPRVDPSRPGHTGPTDHRRLFGVDQDRRCGAPR